MTVKKLKEILNHYDDNAEVIVAVCDNADYYTFYTSGCYDTFVEGNEDKKWDGETYERGEESTEVYIKVYR